MVWAGVGYQGWGRCGHVWAGVERQTQTFPVVLHPPFLQGATEPPSQPDLKSPPPPFPPTSSPQGATEPPPRLTERDLLTKMEEHGIGTDATIAEHIQKQLER